MIKINGANFIPNCSVSHIEHCYLSGGVKARHYDYYGKRVFRGTLVLELKDGLYFFKFEEKDNVKTLTYLKKIQFRKTYIRFSEDYTNIIVETLENDKEQLRKDVEDWTRGELARLEKLMTQTQQKINTIKETQPQ